MTAYFDQFCEEMQRLLAVARVYDSEQPWCIECGRPKSSDSCAPITYCRREASASDLSFAIIECLHVTVKRLRDKVPAPQDLSDHLREREERLIRDVMLTTTLPGFPSDIADAIDSVILKRSVYSQPLLPNLRQLPGPDFEYITEHVKCLNNLANDFHDIFHALVRTSGGEFSDKPYDGERALLMRADLRLEMAGLTKAVRETPEEVHHCDSLRSDIDHYARIGPQRVVVFKTSDVIVKIDDRSCPSCGAGLHVPEEFDNV